MVADVGRERDRGAPREGFADDRGRGEKGRSAMDAPIRVKGRKALCAFFELKARLVSAHAHAVKMNRVPTYGRTTLSGINRNASAMNTSPVQCMGTM